MIKMQTLLGAKHKILYGFTALLMGLAATLMMSSGANALVPAGVRQIWVGSSNGTISWDQSSDYLSMHTSTASLPANYCGDSIFDWARDDGNPFNGADHHDARIVRVCQSWASHTGTMNPDSGGSLNGMQKAAFCVGPIGATTAGSCANGEGAEQGPGSVNVNVPNFCVRAWVKDAGGGVVYHSGGASTSCSS